MRALTMAVALIFCAVAQPVPAARAAKSDAWDKYVTSCRKELNSIGVRIDVLEARSRSAGATSRDQIRAEVDALRARKGEVDRILGKLESSGKDARQELSRRFDEAVKDLKTAFDEAKRKFA
jgi:hypothetical protein